MQKHYKLIAGLLVCVLGINLKAAEALVPVPAPVLTRDAVADLRGAARNCTVQQNFFDTALSTNPQATIDEERKRIDEERKRIDAARPRVGRAVLTSLCRNLADVGALVTEPDQEVVADGTAQARQAAERIEIGSADGEVELEPATSVFRDLIERGRECTIEKTGTEFIAEISRMECDNGYAFLSEHMVYFVGVCNYEGIIFCCNKKYYMAHIKDRLQQGAPVYYYDLPEKMKSGDIKKITGILKSLATDGSGLYFEIAEHFEDYPSTCAILDPEIFNLKLKELPDYKKNNGGDDFRQNKKIIRSALNVSCSGEKQYFYSVFNCDTNEYDIYELDKLCLGLVKIPGLKMGARVPGQSGVYEVVKA